jgi:hypothetical protein
VLSQFFVRGTVFTQTANSFNFSASAMEGIAREVLNAYNILPRRGVEVGGVLLGRYEGSQVSVEDYEPVTSEHRWGPSYILSEADLRGLEETIASNEAGFAGLRPVGFYRSHTRSSLPCDDRDRGLFDRFFPDVNALFLLLRPNHQQSIVAAYFRRVEGRLAPIADPRPFRSDPPESLPVLEPAERNDTLLPAENGNTRLSTEEDRPPAENARSGREIPPPVHRRLTAPDLPPTEERRAYRDRRWIGALAVLFAGAAALGYWSLGSRSPHETEVSSASVTKPPAPEPPVPAAKVSPPITNSPVPSASPAKATPAVKRPLDSTPAVATAVHAVLDQWDRALKSGNPKEIAAFYAPKITYFGERNVSNADVARSLSRSAARYGKTTVLRLSDLKVAPIGDDRASATFRKRWQTSGAHLYSGETEERVVLAKYNGVWKISSEQETRVLWTERSR